VALLAAGERFLGRQSSPVHLARAARDLEARLMGLPTGLQDHFPALLGGVLQIVYEPAEERVRPLVVDLDGLAVSMLVVFTGVSHFSAGNNWRILERFFAGEVEVRARFERIGALAAELVPLLEAGDWAHAGALMAAEWAERRALAPGITTAVLDQTLAEAEALGAYGGKACGAGGGGCLVFLVPPERRKVIGERMAARGLQVLPAAPSAEPLRIDTGEGA
jgi:D-glycero-alpha-D-manno-heptose-7-phosphate kinase